MRTILAVAVIALLTYAVPAHAQDYSRTAKLSKGKAKVTFTVQPAEGTPDRTKRSPRVGIAPSPNPSFGNFLAKHLDDAGTVVVVPASRLQRALPLGGGFEQMMRSELLEHVSAACREGSLDYVLVMGNAQRSTKTDITSYIVFIGRMRMRNRQESRLYDCKSRQAVWSQSVLFETSQASMSVGFGGVGAGILGGPEAEQAMAGLYAEKLTADMRW